MEGSRDDGRKEGWRERERKKGSGARRNLKIGNCGKVGWKEGKMKGMRDERGRGLNKKESRREDKRDGGIN